MASIGNMKIKHAEKKITQSYPHYRDAYMSRYGIGHLIQAYLYRNNVVQQPCKHFYQLTNVFQLLGREDGLYDCPATRNQQITTLIKLGLVKESHIQASPRRIHGEPSPSYYVDLDLTDLGQKVCHHYLGSPNVLGSMWRHYVGHTKGYLVCAALCVILLVAWLITKINVIGIIDVVFLVLFGITWLFSNRSRSKVFREDKIARNSLGRFIKSSVGMYVHQDGQKMLHNDQSNILFNVRKD